MSQSRHMSDFDWRTDATRCYDLAIAAKREEGVRWGQIAPATPHEARWAAEGPVPVQQMQAGRT